MVKVVIVLPRDSDTLGINIVKKSQTHEASTTDTSHEQNEYRMRRVGRSMLEMGQTSPVPAHLHW